MKKICSLLLAVVILTSLCACGNLKDGSRLKITADILQTIQKEVNEKEAFEYAATYAFRDTFNDKKGDIIKEFVTTSTEQTDPYTYTVFGTLYGYGENNCIDVQIVYIAEADHQEKDGYKIVRTFEVGEEKLTVNAVERKIEIVPEEALTGREKLACGKTDEYFEGIDDTTYSREIKSTGKEKLYIGTLDCGFSPDESFLRVMQSLMSTLKHHLSECDMYVVLYIKGNDGAQYRIIDDRLDGSIASILD